MTNVEITEAKDWETLMMQEELEVKAMCDCIIKAGVDVVFAEKGVSDLAQYYLLKANISVIRRCKKTDTARAARVCGASVCHRTEEITPGHVGTRAKEFKISKIGDEYYTYLLGDESATACTILLRGGSRDVLHEMERNLHDAMNVARNLKMDPRIVPGGGALEMYLSTVSRSLAEKESGCSQILLELIAESFEQIPRILIANTGASPIEKITELRARHAAGEKYLGVDGITGELINTIEKNIFDPLNTRLQVVRSALEATTLIVRVDEIITAIKAKER